MPMRTVPNDLHLPFHVLEDSLNEVLIERTAEIHTSSLALIGRQHHFTLGEPGIAKSLLVDQTTKRIVGVKAFDFLMTRVTQAEELLGGPNVLELTESGIFRRVTTGMLPEAEIVFLDEIFKASSAILNALLKALNERTFARGGGEVVDIPLHTMYAASNELAASDELAALWDRLHFRHVSRSLQETSNFARLLAMKLDPEPPPVLDKDTIIAAHDVAREVKITDPVIQAVIELKKAVEEAGITVSDRRWKEAMTVIRSEAFFNGNMIADVKDTRPLMHFLWSNPDHAKTVRRLVLELANPLEREAAEWMDDLQEAYTQYLDARADSKNLNAGQITNAGVQLYKKLEKNKHKLKSLFSAMETDGRKSDTIVDYSVLIERVGQQIVQDLDVDE